MIREIPQRPGRIRESARLSSRPIVALIACIFLIGLTLAAVPLLWRGGEPRMLAPAPLQPQPVLTSGIQLSFPGKHLTTEIGRYDYEIDAYKAASMLRNAQVGGKFLVTVERGGAFVSVRSELPNDLLVAIPELERLRASGIVEASDWAVTDSALLRNWWHESRLFEQLYLGLETPKKWTRAIRSTLVADIAITTSFFDLPISVFLLTGTPRPLLDAFVWQPGLQSGRIALFESNGKYLTVSRESVKWQETRTALKHAHRLYVSDRRDYRTLPERLRPLNDFREALPPPVLLTYAALLLRDLADKSLTPGGNLGNLIGIRPDDPNARQEVGVRRASLHARRALAHALEVNRECLLEEAASEASN